MYTELNTITASKAYHDEPIRCHHKSNEMDDCEDEVSVVTVCGEKEAGDVEKRSATDNGAERTSSSCRSSFPL